MSMIGLLGLLVAFAGCVISVLCLGVAHILYKKRSFERSETFAWGGRVAAVLVAAALTVCCAVLVWCFFSGDNTIQYVLDNRSTSTAPEAWLYKLAGLWAGRQGSLLFWAWLIAVFNAVLVFATRKNARPLDNGALAISSLVLTAFVSVLLFSEGNMPFIATDARYFTGDGTLSAMASARSMNALLEHWAMAIHPPTLFIGYAGLTIPFAYAIAALIVNDDSTEWVNRSTPYLMFSWLLLGIGIGLGAVWAYVVLGWGGYWGWDPVENASLLPWLVGVALIHSFTVYRQRGAFKRWSVFCACLTFCFVVLGTFITRSGLVQSVHAFEGDPVSLVMFGALIICSLLAGIVGLIVRRKSFGATDAADDDIESMMSKEAAYYVNNLIMIVFAVLLAYMTVSSALPSWLPFGGQSLSAGTYNAIARPLGIAYLAVLAICPLLGWRRTDKKAFWRSARVPALCALVLFIVLMIYFATYLLPSYQAMIDMGGTQASGLLEQGNPIYYNGLAVVGFAVASLLFFNALFMAVRSLKRVDGAKLRRRLALFGGSVAHAAMAIILVGLIGSSMYVTEITGYLPYDEESDSVSETFDIQDFQLTYTGNSIDELGNGNVRYALTFDVTKDGQFVGTVNPAVQLVSATQQQKLEASVIGFPLEDLFVVYRGVNDEGDFSMDVRVNPLISFVWVGFALLMVGCLIPLFAKRAERRRGGPAVGDVPAAELAEAEPKERDKASRDVAARKGVVEETVDCGGGARGRCRGRRGGRCGRGGRGRAPADADADAADAGRRRGSSPVETALSVDHLTKSFGGRKAVDDVSFALPEGAFLSVFGPNGAGKTTLLRMLATLSRPTEGTITLAGIDVKEEPERVREAIGLISHNPMLYPDLTAEENLLLYAKLYGVADPAEARDRASGRRGAQAPPARSGAHVLARHDPARLHRPGARERPVGGAARRALLGARSPCHAHLSTS